MTFDMQVICVECTSLRADSMCADIRIEFGWHNSNFQSSAQYFCYDSIEERAGTTLSTTLSKGSGSHIAHLWPHAGGRVCITQ